MMTSSFAFQVSTRILTRKRGSPFLSYPPWDLVSEKCVIWHRILRISLDACKIVAEYRGGKETNNSRFPLFRDRRKLQKLTKQATLWNGLKDWDFVFHIMPHLEIAKEVGLKI